MYYEPNVFRMHGRKPEKEVRGDLTKKLKKLTVRKYHFPTLIFYAESIFVSLGGVGK